MAANPDLLSHLADIYEPELIIPWQPALGHWLLLGIVLLVLGILLWQGYRRWQAGRPRRAALAELKHINWQDPAAAATVNQLLKRLLQSYHPQHPILNSSTQHWQQFLQSLLPAALRLPDLQALLYQPPNVTSEAARQQWQQASMYIINNFSVKTAANAKLQPKVATPLAEKNHA